MTTPVLTSARLTLDAITALDAAAIFEYCQDESIQRYTRVPVPYERAHAEHFTATSAANDDFCRWAIRLDSQLVGVVEVRFDQAELGYWIGATHRGSGVMTEALGMVIDYAFDPSGFDLARVTWEAAVGNTASATVAQRNGFAFDGTMPGGLEIRGEHHDAWRASLSRLDRREPRDGWPR